MYMQVIWVGRESKYFSMKHWTTQITLTALAFLFSTGMASCRPVPGKFVHRDILRHATPALRAVGPINGGSAASCRCSLPVLLSFQPVQGEHIERYKSNECICYEFANPAPRAPHAGSPPATTM